MINEFKKNNLESILYDEIPSIIPLIYDNTRNTNNIKNILLIDSNVTEEQLFFTSSNTNTFPIIYSCNSDKNELFNLLEDKFKNGINKIGFVFHDPGSGLKSFLNNTVFFNDNDLIEKQTTFSENVNFLDSLVKKFHISNFDFLACNTLQYAKWKTYYDLLNRLTNVIYGASNDNTGNIKYVYDWIMENTNQDIKNIYFNDSIDKYSTSLSATTLTQSGGNIDIQTINIFSASSASGYIDILQYKYASGNWITITNFPINIVNTSSSNSVLTITLTTNLTINNIDAYFICNSSYITFNGSNKTCTIDGITNYRGLIQNGSPSVDAYHSITVKNIKSAIKNSSTLYSASGDYCGWICQSNFGKNIKKITNFNASTNYILVDNCSNSGATTLGTGGICGSIFANNGVGTISNCSNSGLLGYSAGGICGCFVGQSGNVTITNCSNSATIVYSAGGICGQNAGYYGSVTVTNCSNSGIITQDYAGGICGGNAGYSGTATVSKCFNTGNITGNYCGGITGDWFGFKTSNPCSITNCYNIGDISGSNSGGICGAEIGFTNDISCNPIINISNCYSLGSISTKSGGLLGGTEGDTYSNIPIITIANCYTNGTITDTDSGLISNNIQIKSNIIINNCYIGNNNWNDTSANTSLTGTPSSANSGTTWTDINTSISNIPYVLSCFNSKIYEQDNINNGSFLQTHKGSSNGLFSAPFTYKKIYSVIYDSIASSSASIYTNSGITIDPVTGIITFADNIPLYNTKYQVYVFVAQYNIKNNPYNYNVNTFSMVLSTLTQNGGNIDIRFSSGLQYKYATDSDWTTLSKFPINIVNSSTTSILTITFTTDLTINDIDAYFICNSSYITFNGSNKICTIDGITNYRGLIQNGSLSANGYHTITVKNIKSAIKNLSTLYSASGDRSGWICQGNFGKNIKNITSFNASNNYILVDNCSNSGTINGVNCGGLCGNNFLYNGFGTISNCSNSGSINNDNAGGICGVQAGINGGSVTVTNCTNSGSINGYRAGGICGSSICINNGIATITDCSNSGLINNYLVGGICGSNAGQNGNVIVINCSNSSDISGNFTGGICGSNAGQSGTATISKCFNTGNITGNYSGGITGDWFGCYTNNTCSITNCYNTGNISGSDSGGICGAEIGFTNDISYNPIINISNCYSLGSISTKSGGLLGGTEGDTYTGKPVVTITNCYTNGVITDIGSGLISNNLQIKNNITINNCYIGNNNWNDILANALLTGTPSSNNPGTIWTDINTSIYNIPYVLSCFNSKIYEQDIINNSSVIQTPYNSSNGLFTTPLSSPFTYSQIYSLIYNEKEANIYSGSAITINSKTGSITFANNVSYYTSKYVVYVFVAQYNVNNFPYNYNVNTFTISSVSCFNQDTKILCLNKQLQEEYIVIQDLRSGDLVKSYLHGYRKIKYIGKDNMYNDPTSLFNSMYKLEKTEENGLLDDLIITGAHGILVDQSSDHELQNQLNKFNFYKEIDNKKILLACMASNFKQLQDNNKYTYYHFTLENNGDNNEMFGVWANGVLTETPSNKQFSEHAYEII